MDFEDNTRGERLAKFIAKSGVCSRRDAELLIEAGRVKINGILVTSRVNFVKSNDVIEVDDQSIAIPQARMWIFHKPKGITTTHKDELGRATVFDVVPLKGYIISIGRLDMNSEGLLLLTNSGELARFFELPINNFHRKYRCRIFGKILPPYIDQMKQGLVIDGVKYNSIDIVIDSVRGSNSWVTITLHEGKNREIRKIFEYFGLQVSRLIRIEYGEFRLGSLGVENVLEIHASKVDKYVRQLRSFGIKK